MNMKETMKTCMEERNMKKKGEYIKKENEDFAFRYDTLYIVGTV